MAATIQGITLSYAPSLSNSIISGNDLSYQTNQTRLLGGIGLVYNGNETKAGGVDLSYTGEQTKGGATDLTYNVAKSHHTIVIDDK